MSYVKNINGYDIKDEEARQSIGNLQNSVSELENGSLKLHSLAKSSGTNIIEFPNGKNMFIDTGTADQWSDIQTAISSLGITKFDYAVITHFHPDHYGNMQNFINTYDLSDCVFYIGMKPDYINHSDDLNDPESLYDGQVNILRNAGFNPIVPVNDSYVDICEGVQLHFLNTSPVIAENYYGRQAEYYTDGKIGLNDFSLITEIIHKDVRILSTGDLEAPVEEQYASYLRKVNIMLMPHHGFNEDAYKPFYTTTRPDYAICNVVADTEEWVGIRHKGFMFVKNNGSYIVTNKWSKGENNIFTFISNGKQVFSNVKGEGLGEEPNTFSFTEGKLYRQIQQLINYTSDHQASTITLDELISHMNVGSKLSVTWRDYYNTDFAQLYSDLMTIFPKFYYNMIVDIERINDRQDRITVHNKNLKFTAYRLLSTNWNTFGQGITVSLGGDQLLDYIKQLPVGKYTCPYFTDSSNTDMTGGVYILSIDIVDTGDSLKAALTCHARSAYPGAINGCRFLIGYANETSYLLKKVL